MDSDASAEFRAKVAHNLRSPLAAIAGCAETLESRWDELSVDQRRQLLEALSRQARTATALLEEIRAGTGN